MADPRIAVVISTRRRETRLSFALEALARQTLSRDQFEVIVVRHDADRELAQATAPPELRLRSVYCAESGTASKRNLGWRSSGASLVAFTDDDCRPSPQWLARLLERWTDPDLVIQGRTQPDPAETHLDHGLARTVKNDHESGWFETCNIAYSRDLLDRLNGFDETIDFIGNDTDLGIRALAVGARVVFCDEALVWHAVHWRSFPAAVRDAWQRGNRPEIVARHPGLRSRLWLGVFADRDHARALSLAIGLAAFGRGHRVLGLLALAPYLKKRTDLSKRSAWRALRTPGSLLTRATVDLTEVASFAVWSARSRTLVL